MHPHDDDPDETVVALDDAPPAPNRRILIIDDNPRIHDDFRTILVRESVDDAYLADLEAELFGAPEAPRRGVSPQFELDSAYQGREGLEKVRASVAEGRPYALAFVDVRMPPGWDGIETIRYLWEADPLLQVVICTAYSDYSWEETLERLPDPERFLILKKPFDTVVVRQLAHSLTEKWARQRLSRDEVRRLQETIEKQARDLEQTARGPALDATSGTDAVDDAVSGLSTLLDALRQGGDVLAARSTDAEEDALEGLLRGLPATVDEALRGLERLAGPLRELRHVRPRPPVSHGPTELDRVVAAVLADRIEAWRGVARLRCDYGAPPALPLPADEIASIVREGIDNAVNALRLDEGAGAHKGLLSVRTALEDGDVVLEVHDSGPGVADEVRARAFDPWFSTWDRDGQGLSVVQRLVVVHGGEVALDDHPDGGARLIVRWPAA